MGVVKVQAVFGSVVVWPAAHHVEPHASLGANVMIDVTHPHKRCSEPFFVGKHPSIKIAHNTHNWILPQHRIKLPKLNWLFHIIGGFEGQNFWHAMCVFGQKLRRYGRGNKFLLGGFSQIATFALVDGVIQFTQGSMLSTQAAITCPITLTIRGQATAIAQSRLQFDYLV